MHVSKLLDARRIPYEALLHPPAGSAQARAKRLHVSGHSVSKCVLLRAGQELLLAVLPATARVDLKRLKDLLRCEVRLGTPEEISDIFHDCEWGAVTPFGTLYGLPTLLEDSIESEDWIVVEGQTHMEAIRIRCADFERLEQPRRLRFAEASL